MSVTGSLVGRSAELRALEDALARLDGGAAQAVELVGPAGIGKTRLLAELGERRGVARAPRARRLGGRARA